MTNFDGKEFQDEFKVAFGKDISEATIPQLWFLVKFAKHVRGRCRNNSAFNNYMNRNFTGHTFREVPKTSKCTYCDGKGCVRCHNTGQFTYDGLEIK